MNHGADSPLGTDAPFRILLIEDNPGDARLIAYELDRVPDMTFELRTAERLALGVEHLETAPVDLVLLDLSLPDSRGLQSLDMVLKCRPDIPVVVLTGLDDETLALEALRRGAQDYVIKGNAGQRMLARTVRYAAERSQSTASVEAAHAKFRLMFEESPIGFVFSELDGTMLEANQAFLRLAGYADDELGTANVWELLSKPSQRDHPMQAPVERRGGPIEMELRHARGDLVPVSLTWTIVDERRMGRRVWLTFEDLSQYRMIEQRLLQLSMYDALTGLANRNLFHAALVKALARAERSGRTMALLMIDLDGFKRVNDTLGHAAGDTVLRGVAHRLSARLRSADQVARIGGDEFAVILENVEQLTDVAFVARKIISAVAPPFEIDGKEFHCGASVGIAGWPEHAADAPALQRAADLAMYVAKALGGSTYRYYSDSIREEFDRRATLDNELRRAQQYQEFELHYQPQIDLATGRITGAEALLRWRHPARGLLCAADFIEGLESSGQIEAVGYWVLEAALEQLERWQARFGDWLTIAINLSVRQLAHHKLLPHMMHVLERHVVDPACIELELTESAVVSTRERELLNQLHALGVRVTVDDFGTGYSSLQYLKLLPIQALKVDQTFVSGIPGRDDDVAIIGATLALARSLDLEVIAEGVETVEQLEFLRAHGCDRAQGFLIGRPVPAEDFARLLEDAASAA